MNYTTVEQSKKLLELGLNSETADMYYDGYGKLPVGYPGILMHKNSFEYDTPCWSLGALMELMPKIKEDEDDGGCYPTLCKGYNTNKWHCVYRSSIYITDWCDTSINAAFDMVVWLLENGYIKKGK